MCSTSSRIRGALYGVAVTDALGGPVEFKHRGSFPPVTEFRYNGNFKLPPGAWTDDTSMTLCLAESLVDNGGNFVLHDQIARYIKWYKNGYLSSTGQCFDIGNATRQALGIWADKFRHTGGTVEVNGRLPGQARIDEALNREYSCGNGSLMRCVPIPLVFHNDREQAEVFAELASIPTHPHPICIEACQLYTRLIVDMLVSTAGPTKSSVFTSFQGFKLRTEPMIKAFAKYESLDFVKQIPDSEISSSGFVVHTLDAAFWAFLSTDTFRDGALKVVNLGNDADTVGAVFGGLAGAFYGFDAIPDSWINGLQAKEVVDRVVDGMASLPRSQSG